jgi:hypothetical protein
MADVGDHRMKDPTYVIAKRAWDLWSRGFPGAEMGLDLIGGGDGLTSVDHLDGAMEPDSGETTLVEESTLGGPPGVGEQVESLGKSALGMGVESHCAARGVVTGAPSFAVSAATSPLDGAPGVAALVCIADDGGEVAIADARLAATGVGAEAALGIAQIVERVAAEGADESLPRAGHGVLGVNGFEEETRGAVLGSRMMSLLLDDGAEDVGVLAVERMAQMPPTGNIDAQKRRHEQRADVASEIGATQGRNGIGEAVQEVEERRDRVLDGAEATLDGSLRRRRALALRRVLDGERIVGLLGGLGDERLALVGDELQAFAAGDGLGDDGGDQLGGLALVNGEGVEEVSNPKRPVARSLGGSASLGGGGGGGAGRGGRCCHECSVRSGRAMAAQKSRALMPCSSWSRSNAQTISSWTVRRRTGTRLIARSRVASASSAPRSGARSQGGALRRPRRMAAATSSANASRTRALRRLSRSGRGPPSGMSCATGRASHSRS